MNVLLLAAGLGTRLKPYTDNWPKCLMPVQDRPLLEYWLENVKKLEVSKVLVNTHYLHSIVHEFLDVKYYKTILPVYEPKLLGTAGTIINNYNLLNSDALLLAHADNWCTCDLMEFKEFHEKLRPKGAVITMMTFRTNRPENCGIVEVDNNGIVQEFHEKIKKPPGNLANGAVYIIEPEVIEWLRKSANISDFSTQVIPNFLGKIATWENTAVHRDIGTIDDLILAQHDQYSTVFNNIKGEWYSKFLNSHICKTIKDIKNK